MVSSLFWQMFHGFDGFSILESTRKNHVAFRCFGVSVFIHPSGPRTSCQVTNLLGLLKHFECCDHFVGKVVNIDLYRRP